MWLQSCVGLQSYVVFENAKIRSKEIFQCSATKVSRDSAIDIATRYGLDGPGIEPPVGAKFSAPAQIGPGAHPDSCKMGTASTYLG